MDILPLKISPFLDIMCTVYSTVALALSASKITKNGRSGRAFRSYLHVFFIDVKLELLLMSTGEVLNCF